LIEATTWRLRRRYNGHDRNTVKFTKATWKQTKPWIIS
jgi:hypothetical protein